MSAVGWSEIETAIVAWIEAGASLDSDHVQWSYEAGGIPASGPWIQLELTQVDTVGHPWKVKSDNPDSTGSDGRELLVHARSMLQATLTVQCFGVEASGADAMHRMVDLVAALALSYDDLDDAGAGIGEVSPIQQISGMRGSVLEPRARFTVGLHLAAEVTSTNTYVQYVQIKLQPKNELGVVLETDLWVPPL